MTTIDNDQSEPDPNQRLAVMVAVNAITDMLARADKECKAIEFVSNLKGAFMEPSTVSLSHGGGEGGGSSGVQRALPQDY